MGKAALGIPSQKTAVVEVVSSGLPTFEIGDTALSECGTVCKWHNQFTLGQGMKGMVASQTQVNDEVLVSEPAHYPAGTT